MFFRALVIDTPKWAYGTSKTLHASHTIDLCTQSSPPKQKILDETLVVCEACVVVCVGVLDVFGYVI